MLNRKFTLSFRERGSEFWDEWMGFAVPEDVMENFGIEVVLGI